MNIHDGLAPPPPKSQSKKKERESAKAPLLAGQDVVPPPLASTSQPASAQRQTPASNGGNTAGIPSITIKGKSKGNNPQQPKFASSPPLPQIAKKPTDPSRLSMGAIQSIRQSSGSRQSGAGPSKQDQATHADPTATQALSVGLTGTDFTSQSPHSATEKGEHTAAAPAQETLTFRTRRPSAYASTTPSGFPSDAESNKVRELFPETAAAPPEGQGTSSKLRMDEPQAPVASTSAAPGPNSSSWWHHKANAEEADHNFADRPGQQEDVDDPRLQTSFAPQATSSTPRMNELSDSNTDDSSFKSKRRRSNTEHHHSHVAGGNHPPDPPHSRPASQSSQHFKMSRSPDRQQTQSRHSPQQKRRRDALEDGQDDAYRHEQQPIRSKMSDHGAQESNNAEDLGRHAGRSSRYGLDHEASAGGPSGSSSRRTKSRSRSPTRVKTEVKQEAENEIPGLTHVGPENGQPQTETVSAAAAAQAAHLDESRAEDPLPVPAPSDVNEGKPILPAEPPPPIPPPPPPAASGSASPRRPKLAMPPIRPLVSKHSADSRYKPSMTANMMPVIRFTEERAQSFVARIPSDAPISGEAPTHTLVGTSEFKTTYKKEEQLGEGTFGVVWKGTAIRSFGPSERSKRWREQAGLSNLNEAYLSKGQVKRHEIKKGTVVALKQILRHQEFEGMPITSLREIKILKMLDHANCVALLDMASEEGDKESTDKNKRDLSFMVFPYMDHDLAGLLFAYKLPEREIKLFTWQVLEGTEYLHSNHILHRDMKSANLLVDKRGLLKIADFGLARPLDPKVPDRKYTGTVVTRWYRPPELLLGERQYTCAVDIWGIGCIVAEMFIQRPYLPGSSDLDQAQRIFNIFGRPSDCAYYHERELAFEQQGADKVSLTQFNGIRRTQQEFYKFVPKHQDIFIDFMERLMDINPRTRITASQALGHDWFFTLPKPATVGEERTWQPSKEMDRKRERDNQVARQQQHMRPAALPQMSRPAMPPHNMAAPAAPGAGLPQRPGYGSSMGGGHRPAPSGFLRGGRGGGGGGGYGSSGSRQNRAPPPNLIRKQ